MNFTGCGNEASATFFHLFSFLFGFLNIQCKVYVEKLDLCYCCFFSTCLTLNWPAGKRFTFEDYQELIFMSSALIKPITFTLPFI